MIPGKILVYRAPEGATRSEVYKSTRRRKKSLGDLYQNGYRIKAGPTGRDKPDASGWSQSLASCYRMACYWGKNCLLFLNNHMFVSSISCPLIISLEKKCSIYNVLFYASMGLFIDTALDMYQYKCNRAETHK